MTVDGWLKAWQDAETVHDADGMSTEEIAALWNTSLCTAQRRIRKLVTDGFAKFAGYRTEKSLIGVPKKVPVFTLTDSKG
jgi:transposase